MIAAEIKGSALPAYLMNVPLSMATDQPNNAIMIRLTAEQRVVNRGKAMEQWLELHHFFSSRSLVYLTSSIWIAWCSRSQVKRWFYARPCATRQPSPRSNRSRRSSISIKILRERD